MSSFRCIGRQTAVTSLGFSLMQLSLPCFTTPDSEMSIKPQAVLRRVFFLERIMYLLCVCFSLLLPASFKPPDSPVFVDGACIEPTCRTLSRAGSAVSATITEPSREPRVATKPSLLFAVKQAIGRFLATLSRRPVGGLWCDARCVEQAWKRHGVGSVTVQRIKSHESLEGSERRDQMSLLGKELSSILRMVSRRNGNWSVKWRRLRPCLLRRGLSTSSSQPR